MLEIETGFFLGRSSPRPWGRGRIVGSRVEDGVSPVGSVLFMLPRDLGSQKFWVFPKPEKFSGALFPPL
jgi:hypothetical protein